MNMHFAEFKKRLNHPIKFRLFTLAKLPAAFFAGLRLEHHSQYEACISVRYSWFTQNPFRSLYFAVQSMAAEASTGIVCMGALYKIHPTVSMLITKIEGNFLKKVTGKISFTCSDGIAINEAVANAIATGQSQTVICTSTGTTTQGEVAATFLCTWSFKARATA